MLQSEIAFKIYQDVDQNKSSVGAGDLLISGANKEWYLAIVCHLRLDLVEKFLFKL